MTRVYHSHVDGPRDVYSGLVGPLIICKEGVQDGAKAKEYEEFILMFSVVDENLSWYLDDNINTYCTDPDSVDKDNEDFQESNLMHWPVILAEVGDFIKVTFKNNASRPYSIQAHGVSYTKDMEGAVYKTGNNEAQSQASHVAPGDTFTYEWNVPSSVGSTIHDLNCLPWLYYSSVDAVRDTNSGLVGPLLVCKKLINNTQRGVAHNYFLMPNVFDENKSWYLEENIELFTSSPHTVNKEDADFQESNMMHSINGYMYGNQPGLDMCRGDSIRWSMLGLGTEVDMHGIHFTGNTIKVRDVTRDVASVFPHISYGIIMEPDNEGVFNVECMTTDHYTGGMRQQYRVHSCNKQRSKLGISPIRTYYIAAEEVEWDYSPSRTWEHERHSFHPESPADVFLNKTRTSIGSKYKKAVYQEYTDNTFTARKERTASQEHLGILGPLIKADTGDEIHIIFKNKASRPYSIYAHGVVLEENEIKPTEPGHIATYIWKIPKRSGPNRNEGDCVTWAYYSTVDQTKDLYSGLIGPLVICKKILLPFLLPKVSLSRFALLFLVFNENESWYLDENIKTYSNYPDEVKKDDEKFVESNLMHSINGRMYANLPGLTMHVGDHVMWHLIGMGNEVDIHTVHFHAHSFKYSTAAVYRSDVFDLFPGTFQTVEFTAKNPGTWLLHCHVAYHIHSGMEALYTVLEKKEKLIEKND